ncbi:hypothetical protein [Kibdelosporangium aridum]|nr:hypothetical protein [Kibdelosporangium aridum]
MATAVRKPEYDVYHGDGPGPSHPTLRDNATAVVIRIQRTA